MQKAVKIENNIIQLLKRKQKRSTVLVDCAFTFIAILIEMD
jgi:adenosyl cobinamide kinase/adenosyl cobinamide phosphate guanylyltransferase